MSTAFQIIFPYVYK